MAMPFSPASLKVNGLMAVLATFGRSNSTQVRVGAASAAKSTALTPQAALPRSLRQARLEPDHVLYFCASLQYGCLSSPPRLHF